jgi:uncharacterized protein DUF6600/FecR-like protein
MSRRSLLDSAFVVVLSLLFSLPLLADSHVRIVRLSYIEGAVQVNRTGQFEQAIMNLPITEGTKVRTGADGRAEVEFEDGSTLRLASNTTIQFTQLSLKDNGTKASTVELSSGTEYADIAGSKDSDLTLQFGSEKVEPSRAAHLRITMDAGGSSVAVFKGDLEVIQPSGTVDVKKNQTASFDASANSKATIAKKIEPEPLDSWDKQQAKYHDEYAVNSYRSYSPYAYGSADLSYYGNFVDTPGYGMLWQPYLVGAGWNPFMDGAWAFSPGFGYGWVSAYPWGWLPYHYGTWVFVPGFGWAWQPGGVWMPWYSQPRLMNAPSGFKPPQPPAVIAGKTPGIVAINRGPMSGLVGKSGNKIVIRNNSAGLGVPRGQVANLEGISHNVQRHGEMTQNVHPTTVARPMPPFGGSEMSRGAQPGRPMDSSRPAEVGRGSSPSRAPEPRMSEPSMRAPEPMPSAPAPSASGPHK